MKFAFLLGIKFWLSTLSKVQIFFRREERGGSLTLIRNQHYYRFNPNSFAAQSIDQMCYSILTADSNWDIAVARAARKQLDLALAVHVCHPVTSVARLRSSGITLFQWEVPRHLVHTKALRNKFNIWSLFSRDHFFSFHTKSQQVLGVQVYMYIYIHISYVLREVLTPGDRVRIWRTPYTFSRQQFPRNDDCWHALSRSWTLLLIDLMYAVATLFFKRTAGEDLLNW